MLLAALGEPGARCADLAPASPFLPANMAGTPGQPGGPSGPVELRGMMATSQGIACCIYDTAKKTSVWVRVNETGNDFVVKAADPANDSATVDFQGRNMHLAMRASKVVSAGAAPSGGPAFAGAPQLPSPADEQKRLDAVAAEVRRRRLEREKAFQGGANGAQPAALPPGAPPPGGTNR